MNKNTYAISAILGSLMCSIAWAGIPGTYHCESPAKDKHRLGDIVVQKTGNQYAFTMEILGHDKKIHGTLINTHHFNRFIHSWKREKDVGISEWNFDDKSLTLKSSHLYLDGVKMHKITHCTKK